MLVFVVVVDRRREGCECVDPPPIRSSTDGLGFFFLSMEKRNLGVWYLVLPILLCGKLPFLAVVCLFVSYPLVL